ncbi:MAG: NYN domain-containing protein [Lachnospiraceae bacterium]
MEDEKRYAVLIDAENVSNKYGKLIMDEISTYGVATYKRLYGDYTTPSVKAWIESLKEFAITPVFQCNYTQGKSASDTALIIDAMDILYSENVNGFCLVTSDSDFTKLARRLRESGMSVIGMGEQKTPNSLVAACEEFKFLDLLYNEETQKTTAEQKKKAGSGKDALQSVETVNNIPSKKEIEKVVISIINSLADDDGWVNISEIGTGLRKRVPGFDPRNYKCEKLKQLIAGFKSIEVKTEPNSHHRILTIVYARVKDN